MKQTNDSFPRASSHKLYDVFISHASEDKSEFVRPLVEALRAQHIEVWFDEFSLRLGDSLRESIDLGLSRSTFGIIVISPAFLQKNWTKWELNGLVTREMSGEGKVILPIWHKVSSKDIRDFSLPLANKVAINSSEGIDAVCKKIVEVVRPQGSPLIKARTILLEKGIQPPVITDEWWLDVAEASNRAPCYGYVMPRQSQWGRWSFPLPGENIRGEMRGERLAWTALQMQWVKAAENERITQISHPTVVLQFIKSQTGLAEMCHKYPYLLAEYAPQLTIKGLGGEFEKDFTQYLKRSCAEYKVQPIHNGPTIKGKSPACSNEIALRHPQFGYYAPERISEVYLQSSLQEAYIQFYETFEYIVWFLSSDSDWMPEKIHAYILDGLATQRYPKWSTLYGRHAAYDVAKDFLDELSNAKDVDTFLLSTKGRKALESWIREAMKTLGIKGNAKSMASAFISQGFIRNYLAEEKRMRTMREKSMAENKAQK